MKSFPASLLIVCCLLVAQCYAQSYSGLPLSVWNKMNPSRPGPRYSTEDLETYGYVDRYPPVERPSPRYAFGVPHRFMEAKSKQLEPSEYDLYSDNPFLVFPGRSSLNKRSRIYEDHWEPWVYEDADNSDDYESGYYHSEPDPQDVINFERYLQTYFDKSKDTETSYDDATNDETWLEKGEDTYQQYRNDEDAATQLHSLISPRRPSSLGKVLGLERLLPPQKKSGSATTSTVKPTTIPVTTVSTTSSVKSTGSGQKEEALLRPPSPPRIPVSTPESLKEGTVENDHKTIYDTIKKLFEMHSKLEDVAEEDIVPEESRMKRFVSQEDFLTRQRPFEKNKI